MLNLFLKTACIYIFLLIIMRIGGKRQIGELRLSELVSALLISELASMPLTREDVPVYYGIIPVLTVISIEIISAFAVTKSKFFKNLIDGSPTVLISKGQIRIESLKKLRIGISELISESRLQGIADISEINYAFIEDNGKFSFIPKSDGEKGIAHTIIIDGEFTDLGLNSCNLTEKEIIDKLKSKNIELKNVFLYTKDDTGGENLILKQTKSHR